MSNRPWTRRSSQLRFEVLEERRVLEAVGLFERLDLPFLSADVLSSVAAQAGSDIFGADDSDFTGNDVYATVSSAASNADGNHYASADEMFTASIITPELGTTSVPQVHTAGTIKLETVGDALATAVGGLAIADATFSYIPDIDFPPFMLERHLFIAAVDPRIEVGGGAVSSNYRIDVQAGELSAFAVSNAQGTWTLTPTLPFQQSPIVQAGGMNWHYRERIQVNNVNDLRLLARMQVNGNSAFASGVAEGDVADTIVNMIAHSWAFVWPANMPPAPGDFNADGNVDAADLQLWQDGSPLSDGDLDGVVNIEGVVTDWDDLAIWVANANPTDLAAWAATSDILLVSSDGDIVDSNESFGNFTLREAIAKAATLQGPNIIMVGNGIDEITLTNGPLNIGSGNDINLIGPGADILAISGNNSYRIFSVGSGADVSISKVTLTEGFTAGGGAAIYSQGNVILKGIRATHNEATSDGGAVLTGSGSGSLTVIDSTFDNNSSGRNGGAVYGSMSSGHQLLIQNSTFFANSAVSDGGAIYLYGHTNNGDVTILNSTISGNIASNGGGLFSTRRASHSTNLYTTIINSTITDNEATGTNSVGGGIRSGIEALVTMHNSIVADNTAATSGHADITGLLESPSSYNVIGEANGGVPGAAGAGNQFNVTDPGLGPLADNGGPTLTHALLSGSPALDAGSDSLAPATDQRGFVRPIDLSTVTNGAGGSTDIGAYESEDGGSLLIAQFGTLGPNSDMSDYPYVPARRGAIGDDRSVNTEMRHTGDASLRQALLLAFEQRADDLAPNDLRDDEALFAVSLTSERQEAELHTSSIQQTLWSDLAFGTNEWDGLA